MCWGDEDVDMGDALMIPWDPELLYGLNVLVLDTGAKSAKWDIYKITIKFFFLNVLCYCVLS